MDDDRKLLTAYARDGSEEAFTALARRYLDLVYSVALRQSGNSEQARDVAQAVFLLLARKAESLDPETILAGWLYRTARFVSLEALRAETRRKLREECMASALPEESSHEEIWKEVSPHLDEAMERISELDRNAIILRYFENRPFRDLSAALGMSEEAAKKRVSRALEKLRSVLARKGIRSTGSLLGTALVASAVQPTPPALAAVILPGIGMSSAGALPAKILVKGVLEMMTYTKIQTAAVGAVILLMVGGTGYVGVQRAEALREHNPPLNLASETENRHTGVLGSQQQLLAQVESENQQLREQARELYRTRDTVTQLHARLRLATAPPNALNLQNAPREFHDSAERLRELQYEHFIAAGKKAIVLQPPENLTDEEKAALPTEINFLKHIGLALRLYATDHGDEFPRSIENLLAANVGLDDQMKEQLQSGKYEYILFNQPESKPTLPAVWWRVPDEKGIRLVALNDGSVQILREPEGVPQPGYLTLDGTK
jgi:RNA polymerase sigma factor (sigma-70 family)